MDDSIDETRVAHGQRAQLHHQCTPQGLPYELAAHKLAHLLQQVLRRR